MAATTTAAKKTPAKRAPAKRAPAKKASPVAAVVDTPVDGDGLDTTAREEAVLGVGHVVEADDLADIPAELQFSTDSGERREVETMSIAIDGTPCTLSRPSDSLMILLAASFTPEADTASKVRAMLDMVNASLDEQGRYIIRRMMFASDNSFDDTILGAITGVILNRWSPETRADLTVNKPNRAARRARR